MAEENSELKKSEIAQKEEEILKFWQENKIFAKSVAKEAPKGDFTFYDGPPFANGLPHYGHLIAGTIKDVIPRYKTMQGYKVRRRWGWDCHGLPVENLVEKELGLKSKKDILDYGVENFNQKARESVMRYADEWKRVVPRLGRFVDMEDDYRTMDASYSETIWWIFKQLHDKGLIYEGYKSMHICPRCETTLSNFEVSQGYKDVTDISVTVKFKLKNPEKIGLKGDVFVLAWTTTPWTLPGNVALAVANNVDYFALVNKNNAEIVIVSRQTFIKDTKGSFADYLIYVIGGKEIVIKGRELIGLEYEPVFDYYANDSKLEHKENGWKIYGADFVTTEDGTGVVHIAPAFGEDDLNLGRANNLPFIQHVAMNGTFKPEVKDWPGLLVKPIDSPQSTDVEVLKNLAGRGLLFAKEKFTHSYPHCWRCDTPLLNYAASSWFVKVTDFRDKMVAANQKVNWVPEHVRDGRFGKWLEGARDWAISRSRFWGAPLPVWRCADCGAIKVFGSFTDLAKEQKQSGNKYWAMRHGEAEANISGALSLNPAEPNNLTEKGKQEVKESAQKLKVSKIDLIISSDFVRTKETSEIVASELGLKSEQIIFDERLREINLGTFVGKTWQEYKSAFGERLNRLNSHLPTGGENYNDARRRIMSVFYELDQKYQNKNILVISHGLPLFMLQNTIDRLLDKEIFTKGADFTTGEVRAIDFVPLPHNRNYELDVHRPFIDEIEFPCACGSNFKRVPEVFDCWYESGSMPYAEDHYPFNTNSPIDPVKKIGFPANFISEGLDQTRGWFYSLIVLGVALFGESPYQNVATNGLVLAEDGQKMSKHLRNYPDPLELADRLGADALRLYLMSSPAVRGEDLNFSEKGVAEIGRRIVARLLNVLSFYQLYVGDKKGEKALLEKPTNILDQWILARLDETINQTTEALERYEIDRSVWPIDDFIDDFSTWYLRRSRDRFKIEGADRDEAIATIHFALLMTAKLLAPVAPFVAEMIYRELKTEAQPGRQAGDPESVHLASWPQPSGKIDDNLLAEMQKARDIVSLGLEFRQAAKIKVRQPLSELLIKDNYLTGKEEFLVLIKDELNVKKIGFNPDLESAVWLNTEITHELQEEGMARELIRQIQEKRKTAGLAPGEKIDLFIDTDAGGQEFLRRFETELKLGTTAQKLEYAISEDGEELWAGERPFKVKIIKL